MTITRDQIVEEALRWVGTPAMWQQSTRGRATDCRGLIFGIARDLGLPEASVPEAQVANYRRPNTQMLLAALRAAMLETEKPGLPGDVLAMPLPYAAKRNQMDPQHLGILISDREMVHCYPGQIRRVIRVPVGRSRPIHSVWTWPSLGGA